MSARFEPLEDDRDLPQEIDLAEDGADDLIACPGCGRSLHAEAQICHHCGQWIIESASPATERAHGWRYPLIVAVLVAVILVMWIGLGR